MGTFGRFKREYQIDDIIRAKETDIFDDGACQCFGDCDCNLNRGKFLYTDTRYYHPLSEKSFSSEKGARHSYEHKSQHLSKS